jgi:hypothetical protein
VRSRNSALIGPRPDVFAHSLSSEANLLKLYISDAPPGLAFLYDPILLESPESTYVVQWSEVKASRKTRAYITTAKEKHAELHTFMYTPRKVCHPLPDRFLRNAAGRDDVPTTPKQNVWYYLGERRWSLADIKTLWDSLGPVLLPPPSSPAPETHVVTRLRLNALLHARPILRRYRTGLKGGRLSNSP